MSSVANRAPAQYNYRTTTYTANNTTQQRAVHNVTDDYERWYTEHAPNNRMVLSLQSGIDTEIGWALDRIARLCDNEQFILNSIPGLTDALFEWPEWYLKEGKDEITPAKSLFALDPVLVRRRRHALESLFVLRNSALNEPNAVELMNHRRTQPLIFLALHTIKPDSDANTEFLLNIVELLHTVSSRVFLSSATALERNPIPPLQELAGTSSNRSLIVASLTALYAILSNPPNTAYITLNSPALSASLRYLPLFIDKPLVDACLNFLYVYLSHPAMAKAFLLHPDMPSTLKLLVCHILSEQTEETVYVDLTGPTHIVPSAAAVTRDLQLSKEDLERLMEIPEPQRCYDWMRTMFVAKADGELTQVEFWNLYKDVFMPYQDRYPLLVASDVIKNVNVVFPEAQAMVLPGPPQRFIVRGVDRHKETVDSEKFRCKWDRAQCPVQPFKSPGELYEHLLGHINSEESPEGPCLWATCPQAPLSKAVLRKHVLTHLSSSQPAEKHPSQSESITSISHMPAYPMASPLERPPPPPPQTIVSYSSPMMDPPSSALTALLCIRILFRSSFTTTDEAPRADADHFGFPGLPDDVEEEDLGGDMTVDEQAGMARGRRAFVGVRRLMEGVRIRDPVLMGWIEEMVEAGLSGEAP
ncbi:hypothetical protein PLICRDRAFT_100220 [Plicaturopsis crispa FD-325 SS-3]|nr:hypothetical protein PLICRDRAFT_100220 [Plicaturopsis crispa FD-325 SS-3]